MRMSLGNSSLWNLIVCVPWATERKLPSFLLRLYPGEHESNPQVDQGEFIEHGRGSGNEGANAFSPDHRDEAEHRLEHFPPHALALKRAGSNHRYGHNDGADEHPQIQYSEHAGIGPKRGP